MGGLWSKLRAKPSTKELLEDLEKEIENLEEYKRSTEQQHKRVIGSLIFYFILFFIVGAVLFVFYYFPFLTRTQDKILYSLPLFLIPISCYILKRFLHWYFAQKLKHNEENLALLKKKRRSLLDFAMETETYKIVKDLLEKFDPDYHRTVFETPAIEAPPPPISKLSYKGSFGDTELRKRTSVKPVKTPVVSPGQTISFRSATSHSPVMANFAVKSPTNSPFPPAYLQKNSPQFNVRLPAHQMPRPVLPRERSLMDRLVDYLVQDGPSNRFALICRQCQSHNGMALKEEFDYIAFRCCYCFHWNPPRNQHTPPPRLQLPAPSSSNPTVTEPPSIAEVSNSSGDTDNESLPGSVHEEEDEVVDGSLTVEDVTYDRTDSPSSFSLIPDLTKNKVASLNEKQSPEKSNFLPNELKEE